MKPLIYLAGPYTAPDVAVNVKKAVLLGQRLYDDFGVLTIVPHFFHFEHMLSPKDYEYWMARDLDLIERCDALLRMPGHSPGADREVEHARQLDIPVLWTTSELTEWLTDWEPRCV